MAPRAWLAQVTALRRSWLKIGPSVSRTVGSSPSRQEGVAASSCAARATSAHDTSHLAAASMPMLSRNRRRVGFDGLFISMTLVRYEPRPAPPLTRDVTADRRARPL